MRKSDSGRRHQHESQLDLNSQHTSFRICPASCSLDRRSLCCWQAQQICKHGTKRQQKMLAPGRKQLDLCTKDCWHVVSTELVVTAHTSGMSSVCVPWATQGLVVVCDACVVKEGVAVCVPCATQGLVTVCVPCATQAVVWVWVQRAEQATSVCELCAVAQVSVWQPCTAQQRGVKGVERLGGPQGLPAPAKAYLGVWTCHTHATHTCETLRAACRPVLVLSASDVEALIQPCSQVQTQKDKLKNTQAQQSHCNRSGISKSVVAGVCANASKTNPYLQHIAHTVAHDAHKHQHLAHALQSCPNPQQRRREQTSQGENVAHASLSAGSTAGKAQTRVRVVH